MSVPPRLLSLAELDAMPDLEWLIDGVLPTNSLCVLFGVPGCGKSFVALSMALTASVGDRWLGRDTRRICSLYIAAEGVLGMKYRVRAFSRRHPVESQGLRLYPDAIQIADPAARASVVADLRAQNFTPNLIIIDTLARVAIGKDENSSRDMGEVVAAVDALRKEFSATVLLIHHTRKDGGSERGSSALRGAADVMIECKASADYEYAVELQCSKMKDAEPFEDISIGLERVKLDNGKSSLVVRPMPPLLDRILKGKGPKPTPSRATEIAEVLASDFGQSGATHGELKLECVKRLGISQATFNRTLPNAVMEKVCPSSEHLAQLAA